jgi:hypothetical protein
MFEKHGVRKTGEWIWFSMRSMGKYGISDIELPVVLRLCSLLLLLILFKKIFGVFLRSVLRFLVIANVVPRPLILVTLMMKAMFL